MSNSIKPKYYIIKSDNPNVINFLVFNTETSGVDAYLVGGNTSIEDITNKCKERGELFEVLTVDEKESINVDTKQQERNEGEFLDIIQYIARATPIYNKEQKEPKLYELEIVDIKKTKVKSKEALLADKYFKKMDFNHKNNVKELTNDKKLQEQIKCRDN